MVLTSTKNFVTSQKVQLQEPLKNIIPFFRFLQSFNACKKKKFKKKKLNLTGSSTWHAGICFKDPILSPFTDMYFAS